MKSFRNLRPHPSLQSLHSNSLHKQKLTVMTQTKKKKLSSAVLYKNQFKQAFLCKYGKGQNEQDNEASFDSEIKNLKHQNAEQITSLTASVEFKTRVKQVCQIDVSNRFTNPLWSPGSPINKLMYL